MQVRVALGPDVNGTCFRLYRWPVIEEATSIRFNFAPTRSADSLLFYWPSSLNVSVESTLKKEQVTGADLFHITG